MALLASYQVQSELGDCVVPGQEPPRNEADEVEDLEAISEMQAEYFARTLFVPAEQQTPEFVAKIHELWQSHRYALNTRLTQLVSTLEPRLILHD